MTLESLERLAELGDRAARGRPGGRDGSGARRSNARHSNGSHSGGPGRSRHRSGRSRKRRSLRWRRIRAGIAIVLAALLVWLGVSLGGTLTNPSYGTSVASRLAEWTRLHGGSSIVNWIENVWYSHHPPPVGGHPSKGALLAPSHLAHHHQNAPVVAPVGLPAPAPIVSPASPPLPGEGQWSPAGRLVDGVPAVYETRLRPDAIHTSQVVGVAWLDTKLLKATLYSGSLIPGGGPYSHTAPIAPTAAQNLVTAFNAGFLEANANGGYYTDGRVVLPLRDGAASFVVYRDGSSTVGQWGRDVSLTPDVVSVRQNLDLLVDNGQPAPGLNAADTTQWGNTLGNAVYVWRSGVGVTANGALVYVGGPSLNITDLADLLIRAGAVRAMEMDINTDWVSLATYAPTPNNAAASPANGTDLLPNMVGAPDRYFDPAWARDFITMSGITTPSSNRPAEAPLP